MLRMPTAGHDSVVNDGLFNQEPELDQIGLILALPSFEHDLSPRHDPPTEHSRLYQSITSDFFMRADAGMHSIISSPSAFSSELRSPMLASPYPSASSLSSPSSPGQRQRASCQRPASSYPSHATPLSLQAMVSNSQSPSEPDTIKLSHEKTEAIKRMLSQCAWYAVPDEEPPIRPDDPFITEGLILPTDKTRFSAFVSSSPASRKSCCRIKHSIPTKNKVAECTFSAAHPKDAIAHVCDYLNYKPYKCKGTRWHAECDSRYPTRERRNDHYAKKKKGPEMHELCQRCGASVMTRNLARHRRRCPTKTLERS